MNFTARSRLRTIAWAASALVVLISLPLFARFPMPVGNYVMHQINESGHTALFFTLHLGLILFWVHFAPERVQFRERRIVMLFGLSLFSFTGGIGIEWLQGFVGRDRSWMDVSRNLLGIIAADMAYWSWQRRLDSGGPIRKWPLVVTALCFLLGFSTVFYWSIAQRERDKIYPVLADFEQPVMDLYMRTYLFAEAEFEPAPSGWEDNTSRVARLHFPGSKRWNGFMLKGMRPDWTAFSEVVFELYSDYSDAVEIGVDLRADGYRKSVRRKTYTLSPGVNHIRYPIAGEPAIAELQITDIVWFTMERDRELVLWLDNVRLE